MTDRRTFHWETLLNLALVLCLGVFLLNSPSLALDPRLIFLVWALALVTTLLAWQRGKSRAHDRKTIDALMGLKLALASLIDLKDPYTEGHSRKVRDLTFGFCRFLGLPAGTCNEFMLAAELHDIGKILFCAVPQRDTTAPGHAAGFQSGNSRSSS